MTAGRGRRGPSRLGIVGFLLLGVLTSCSIGGGAATPTTTPRAGGTAKTVAVRGATAVPSAFATPAGIPGSATGQALTPPQRTTVPTPRGEQALTLALGGADPSLDPALVRDSNAHFLVHQLFRGLVRLDEQLNVVPDLAERIAIGEEGRVYTFTLRANAVFHDGKAIDAAAVKYSLERATDPALGGGASLPGATYLNDIAGAAEKLAGRAPELRGVRVLDARTVEIRLDAPRAYFLMKLSYPVSAVVDAANVRAGGRDWARKPNGSGPFRLERYAEQRLVLRRFDRFYAGTATLDRVTFLLGSAASAPMNLYEGNTIDYTRVPVSSVDRVLVDSSPLRAELTITPSLSLTYIGFNVTMPPFDDRAVRRAFAQALNRERVATVSLEGRVALAGGIVPATMPGGPWEGRPLAYDLAASRASLAASRYGGAAALPSARIYGSNGTIAVSMRKVYERDLGVPLEVIGVDWPEYLAGLGTRAYPAFEIGWIGDYPDPENFLALLFGSGSGENYTGYSNAEVDRLLAAAAQEGDPARRRTLYLDAQQIILDDAVIIPCYYAIDYTLVKPHVKGLTITAQRILELDGVWIER